MTKIKQFIRVELLIIFVLIAAMTNTFAKENINVSEKVASLVYSQNMFDGTRHSQYDGFVPSKLDSRVTSSANMFIGYWADSIYQQGTTVMCMLNTPTADGSVTYKMDDLNVSKIKLTVESSSIDKVRSILHLYGKKGTTKTELNYLVSEVRVDRYSVYIYEVTVEITEKLDSFIIENDYLQGRLTAINHVEFYSEINADVLYKATEKAQLLWGLGAIDGSFLTEDAQKMTMTKGDFAKAVCTLINVPKETYQNSNNNSMIDVTGDMESADYISYLISLNYMQPLRDGSFRENEPISCSEAVYTVAKVLGCENIIKYHDFEKSSDYKRLIKNVNSVGGNITVSDACALLYNMLNSTYVLPYDEKSTHSENSYMNEVLHIYKAEGQISQTKYGSLSQTDDLKKDEISINGISYKVKANEFTVDKSVYSINNEKLYSLLGYNIHYYYRVDDEEDERFFISYYTDDRHMPIVLDYDSINVSNGNSSTLHYSDDNNKGKSVRINIENYVVNGKRLDLFSVSDIYNYHDKLTLFDGNQDGIYETVFIYDFNQIVTEGVAESGYKVTAKNKNAVFDFDEDQYDNINYIVDGRAGTFSDIKKNFVLSIAISADDTFLTVFASSKMLSGEFTSMDKSENIAAVNDVEYKIDYEYNKKLSANNFLNFSVGLSGVVYISSDGKIVFFEESDIDDNYGYLVKLGQKNALGEQAECQLVNADSEDEIFTFSKTFKIMYDGQSVRCSDLDDANVIINQYLTDWGKTSVAGIVKYRVNENNNICEIQFPTQISKEGIFSLSYSSEQAVPRNSIIDKKYSYSTAKTFFVPSDVTDFDSYTNDVSLFNSNNKYIVEMYNADDMNNAEAMVCYNDDMYQEITIDPTKVAVIKSCIVKNDENGDERIAIKCIYNGAEQTYLMNDKIELEGAIEDSSVTGALSLKRGTVVKLVLDKSGEIRRFVVIYNKDTDKAYTVGNTTEYNDVLCNVVKTDGKFVLTDSDENKLFSLSNTKVVIYDSDTQGTVSVGTVLDIMQGDKVVMNNNYSNCRNIVILR